MEPIRQMLILPFRNTAGVAALAKFNGGDVSFKQSEFCLMFDGSTGAALYFGEWNTPADAQADFLNPFPTFDMYVGGIAPQVSPWTPAPVGGVGPFCVFSNGSGRGYVLFRQCSTDSDDRIKIAVQRELERLAAK